MYAAPQLESAVLDLGERLGTIPCSGGQHVGRGTRNYLLGLDRGSYLEIIGPDQDQTDFAGERPFGLNTLDRPQLVAWAVRVNEIEMYVRRSRGAGYDPGTVREMSRLTPTGERLSWKLTEAQESPLPRLDPFLIDWGSTRHPSGSAAPGARLVDFYCLAVDTVGLQARLGALGVTFHIDAGTSSQLVAEVAGRSGSVVLS